MFSTALIKIEKTNQLVNRVTKSTQLMTTTTDGQFIISEDDDTCQVNISITTKTYDDGKSFYEISYRYTFSTPHPGYLHPFLEKEDSVEGDIIAKNPMTDEMIRHLLMEETELAKVSGHTDPVCYKVSIMRALSHLWD